MRRSIFFLAAALLALFIWRTASSSVGIRHYLHLMLPKADLYQPIIQEDFPFSEKNSSKLYQLKARQYDFYQVSIYSNNESIPIGYRFKGKVLIELYDGKNIIETTAVDNAVAYFGSDKNRDRYKEISLYEFPIPYKGKYKNLFLKVTVLEPDPKLLDFDSSYQLRVAVSGRP